MDNQYTNYYKNRKVEELQEVVGNPTSYEDEARLAAYKSLQQKEVELSQGQLDDLQFIEDSLKRQIRVKEKEVETEELQEWYSPTAVLGFSVFLPVVGAFMLSYNFRGHKNIFLSVIISIVGVIFTFFIPAIGKDILTMLFMTLVVHTFAGLIFIKFFWKKYLGGSEVKYKRKSILKILLIVVGFIVFTTMQIINNPEVFNEIMKQQQEQQM